jgi:hypothetical protein
MFASYVRDRTREGGVMAKVRVENGCVDIRASLLERVMLAEKSRRLRLSSIRAVNPHPPLVDMKMHWAAQGGVWVCGVSAYDGHLVPSARNPAHTLAIETSDAEQELLYVEVDDELPEQVAQRIERARSSQAFDAPHAMHATASFEERNVRPLFARGAEETEETWGEEDDEDWEDEDVRLRDPLMQGSLPPPPHPSLSAEKRVKPLRLGNDRDLARVGGWLVAVGSFGVLSGTTIVAAGLLPGLIAVGAGIACGVIGGCALALVSHQSH